MQLLRAKIWLTDAIGSEANGRNPATDTATGTGVAT
jgi:hypothetical protein